MPGFNLRSPFQCCCLLVSFLLVCSLWESSCANTFGSSSSSSTYKGSLLINLGTQSSRAIVAGDSDYATAVNTLGLLTVTLTSTQANSSYTKSYSQTSIGNGGLTVSGIVPASDYVISVYGYSDAGGTKQAAQGSTSGVTIIAGTTASSVTIALSFSESATAGAANAGGFSIPMKWLSTSGYAYVYACLDGSLLSIPTVGSADGYYTVTIAASKLAGGSHALSLYFKTSASSSVSEGPYAESVNIWDGVTSTMWVDSSGTLSNTLTFDVSLLPDTTAALQGISINATPLSYSATTSAYYYAFASSTTYSFTCTASSTLSVACSQYNGTSLSSLSLAASSSGSVSTYTGSITAGSAENTLVFTVTAVDRKTTKTYVVTDQGVINAASLASSDLRTEISNLSGSYTRYLANDLVITDEWDAGITCGQSFNGLGHTITLSKGSITGLFASCSSTIKNVSVLIPDGYHLTCSDTAGILVNKLSYSGVVDSCTTSGSIIDSVSSLYVGGLVGANGYSANGGTIENSSSSASISGTGSYYGGLVGENYANGTLANCHATGSIGGGTVVGGLCGDSKSANSITNCYATGSVSGSLYVGGMFGYVNGSVSQCYATGSVTCTSGQAGGFSGNVSGSSIQISNCYALGNVTDGGSDGSSCAGGFVGYNQTQNTYSNCYCLGTAAATASAITGGFIGKDNQTASSFAACYQSTQSGETLGGSSDYSSTLDSALPSAFSSSGLWAQSPGINNGYPYLVYFGASTVTP